MSHCLLLVYVGFKAKYDKCEVARQSELSRDIIAYMLFIRTFDKFVRYIANSIFSRIWIQLACISPG